MGKHISCYPLHPISLPIKPDNPIMHTALIGFSRPLFLYFLGCTSRRFCFYPSHHSLGMMMYPKITPSKTFFPYLSIRFNSPQFPPITTHTPGDLRSVFVFLAVVG